MASFPKPKQILGLAGWLAICFTASAIGAIASIEAGSFYSQLARPDWSPPSWVFGPVWTTLYTLMAVAAWLVWRCGGFVSNRQALTLFLLQLVFNALWSWLFFTWKLGFLSFGEILLLWTLILFTLILFWRVRPLAGALLTPYLLWVSFAAMLNYSLWQFNPAIFL